MDWTNSTQTQSYTCLCFSTFTEIRLKALLAEDVILQIILENSATELIIYLLHG